MCLSSKFLSQFIIYDKIIRRGASEGVKKKKLTTTRPKHYIQWLLQLTLMKTSVSLITTYKHITLMVGTVWKLELSIYFCSQEFVLTCLILGICFYSVNLYLGF